MKMNHEKARHYIEGYLEGENATEEEKTEAWAYMIKTGYCWQLTMWHGRTAKEYLKKGIINEKGEIIKHQK
jgi:hypothetical protein